MGKGFLLVQGDDRWEAYRAHYRIDINPKRLAFEESLSECFDEIRCPYAGD